MESLDRIECKSFDLFAEFFKCITGSSKDSNCLSTSLQRLTQPLTVDGETNLREGDVLSSQIASPAIKTGPPPEGKWINSLKLLLQY